VSDFASWPSKLSITNLTSPGTDLVIEECVISCESIEMA